MPATLTGKHVELDALAGVITHVSAHTAAPGDTGASEVTGGTYARGAYTFPAAAAGALNATADVDLNIPAGVTVTHVSFSTAVTAGTHHYWIALPASQTDAADWILRIDAATIGLTP